ncbi:hypothetical protein CO058_01040 [candidate division WWE3 bacterium CG_4_9_14_0_2_um_filter_35_11]|uniref:Polysaccharide biosynthesis protein C-terminal domain-containing protein n=1 Tax=candidate division WWE3 bacterium CG_4_9_14_0_2_um_filter_35_11 TaxID=1975077 RepID=A0A2M8EMD4_UNCKA|nr:MAG: hypothetical protein COV25_03115 [candidate division WWE3 bacterium CG10_big_fil_rev_8_21_14_0_10_35_32]PJC23904.1 MAG: hypothetical protein CO058_01040 [candidate division WWE3 bacterium CG_4_9_14_0_2_um_filter_35_11]
MKNFPKKILEIYKGNFILSRSSIVIVSSLVGSVFSYLFQFLSARSLSVSEYSELVSLFSLSVIISTVMLIFTNGTTKLVAEIKSINYPIRISNFFFSLMKLVLITTVFVFFGMIIFQNQIGSYLNISNISLIYIFAIAVILGNINSALGPVLQGLQRFKAFSFYNIFNSFAKFLVAIVVLYFGLTVIETFWGLVISTIAGIAFGATLLKKNLMLNLKAFDKKDIKTLAKYSIGSILILAGLNFLQNNDIILVKHYFDSNLAGIYASLTVIGRIVFFAASPVAIVMLPICAERYKHGGDVIKPFLISISISALIASSVSLIYWLFPKLIIGILFGQKYILSAPYLPIFGLFMFVYTLLYVVGMFFISISKFKQGSLMLIGAIIQTVGIYFYHENLYQVIWASIIGTIVSLIALTPFLIADIRKK